VTPNLPEAEVLLGRPLESLEDREEAARELVALGPRAVVVKGGHAEGDAVDVFCDGSRLLRLPAARVATANTHGSGCVFSAAITANLARGLELEEAVAAAKEFITRAIEASLPIGGGHGPVNPLFDLPSWREAPSASR
jgi:hydroxymethylpyrimidine/phosphomethylpyrimidine kinase